MHILVWRRNADDRIILETDAAAIASRVSRPRADTTDIVINEQTVRDACKSSPLNIRLWASTWIVMDRDAILISSLDIQGSIAAAYRTVVDIRIGLVRWIDWTKFRRRHNHNY
jgi:hypothetical protein